MRRNFWSQGERGVVRAYLIAPLAAPLACTLAMIVGETVARGTKGFSSIPSVGQALMLAVAVFAVGTPLAYAAALPAAISVAVAIRCGGRISRWMLLAAGALLGLIVALLLAPHMRGDLISIPFPWWAGALSGIVSAEVFWRMLPPSVRR